MIKKIIHWFQSLKYYVIADPNDNSVTLSKRLFLRIKSTAEAGDKAQVFVFRITERGTFGFMVNPELEKPTQLNDIQYNGKYKCIGFETLNPSVGRIFYEYGLPSDKRIKMSVLECKTPQGKVYYELDKPHAKYIGKHTKA